LKEYAKTVVDAFPLKLTLVVVEAIVIGVVFLFTSAQVNQRLAALAT